MRQRRTGADGADTDSGTGTEGTSGQGTQINVTAQQFDVGSFLFKAGVSFAKRNKKVTGAYLIGLIILLFATGVSVSEIDQLAYSDKMAKLDEDYAVTRMRQRKRLDNLNEEYHQKKGIFFCDKDCIEVLQRRNFAFRTLEQTDKIIKLKEQAAKEHLGVFSEHSVQEVRNLFWGIFAKGRGFSQRSSWFDLLFMGIDSMGRDENLVSFLIRWLFQIVLNFTLGMIGTFTAFIWYLGDVVWSYNPGYITGSIVYGLAVLAAFAMISSFLLALYISAAGTAFVAAKVAGPQILLQAGQRRRRVAPRAHYRY